VFDYLRYYLSPITISIAVVGLYLGGGYVWLGLVTLPALALGDALLPRDLAVRRMNSEVLAFIPVIMSSLLAFATYALLAWQVGTVGLTPFNILGAILTTGWIATIVGVPAFHELFHRRNPFLRKLGLCLQVMYMDATREIAHVVGHHIEVDTSRDSDTARRGESLYFFGLKAMRGSFLMSLKMESDGLEKKGKGRWSSGHRVWRALAGLIAFEGIMFMFGGWAGVAACFVGLLLARFLLETFNYFQHYGQVRVIGSSIEKRHVWNHLGMLSRAMTFEITNHADHHLNPYLAYYELKPDKDAVVLPNVFLCFMAALVPPLWHRLIIMPALKEWDMRATPEEQALARVQNKEAGWPDWFASDTPNTPSLQTT